MTTRRAALALVAALAFGAPAAAQSVTKMPELVTFVEAEYPPEKLQAGVQAEVILVLTVDVDGHVSGAIVQRSAGEDFDAAAVLACKRFLFKPAEVDGKKVASKITYRYAFTITATATPTATPTPTPTATPTPAPTATPTPAPPPTPVDEVTVRAPVRAREATSTTVSADEARRVPGTHGDVLKVVQSLPGVARSSFSSGQLVVWGAAPRETRVYVDGVEIPALYHGSGIRSTVSSELVRSIELVPGAYGAEHGRGLGGLVRVETRSLPKTGTHGYVALDTLDASALVSTALTPRVRVAVSGRYGYLDRALPLVTSRDVSDVYPIPRYGDYQARVEADLRKGEQLRVTLLGSRDDLRRAVLSADPAATQAEDTSSAFQRVYAHYTYRQDDGSDLAVTPFFGRDTSRYAASFGGSPAALDVASWRYGARASYATRLSPWATAAIGFDALGSASDVTRQGSLNLPPREGDLYVFGQPPGSDVAADAFQTHILNAAPYATAELRAGAFTFEPGARLEAFLLDGSRSTPRVGQTPGIGFSRLEGGVDPRLRVRWRADARFSAVAAAGTYHQAPEPEELSAVFGTPALGLSRATHASLGEAVELTRTLSLELTTFYKKLSDLTVRSRLATPLLARALVQDGEGRSYGAQVLVRQRPWRGFFGWVSVTMTRSERRYVDEARWRLFDFDQPHVLTAVAAKELGAWEVGVRVRAATGMPRTPLAGSYFDARGDRYQPLFGEQNTARIPAFFAIDARVQRSWHLGAAAKLDVFVDAQNVTFHANKEEVVYGFDFTRRAYITGLPTLAVVGARLEL